MSLFCSNSVAPSHEPVWLPAFQRIKDSSLMRLGGYLSGKRDKRGESTFFSKARQLSSSTVLFKQISSLSGLFCSRWFCARSSWQYRAIIMASILCSLSSQVTNNGLLIVWKTPEQLCPLFWWQGRHFKVWSSIMGSLLLFLKQASGEKTWLPAARHYFANFDLFITLSFGK